VIAYVFWHRPAADVQALVYEERLLGFHRSLARRPPAGFESSVTLRAPDLPWLGAGGPGYEDWYLVDAWSALGVLEEAAVGRGHRSPHDAAARLLGEGAAGIMHLREGTARPHGGRAAAWVTRPIGHAPPQLADLLADGCDPERVALWQRALVLGPAPELCLLGDEVPAGAREGRLPPGWRVYAHEREPLG
jgi:hypothetical protein